MLARRVIAISEDKEIAKRLGLGLKAAGGSVETYPSIEALGRGEIQAALVVVHLVDGDASSVAAIAERLQKGAQILAVLPRSDLAETVAVMQASPRVAGVLVDDALDEAALAEMATRLLYGDIFGAEKVVPWGTRIYSALVGDYQEKSICIAQLSEYAASMGVRRKYREAIEQVADEMLMNALYDAPVDAEGNQIFADVPTRTRISLRMEQKAVVQYACDGHRFTLSVRDSFGTLERDTVIRYLHKCLHSEQQIDRKTGGAGLGLYIIANATTLFLFNVLPGVATECLVTFDLTAPKVQLKRFGFFEEKIDAAGRLAAGTSRLLPSGAKHPVERRESPPATPAAVLWSLGGAIVLLLALIGLVAYPRFAEPPTATVRIETSPAGALVEIEGRTRGSTTDGMLLVDNLKVGRAYKVTARKDGWNSADAIVEPLQNTTASVVLALEPKAATIHFDTDPSGARVWAGQRELGTTPISITDLPPGQEIDLTFRKAGYRDLTRTVRVPAPGGEAYLSTALQMGADVGSLRITSEPAGAQIYQNDELLAGRVTPVEEHIVEAGKPLRIKLKAPGYMPAIVETRVDPGQRQVPVQATLRPGGALTVRANIDGVATVAGSKQCQRVSLPMVDCPLPNGTHKVSVRSGRPSARKDFEVTIAGTEVTETLTFGFVRASGDQQLGYKGQKSSRLALEEGTHQIELVDPSTGASETVQVQVQANKTTTVP